MDQQEPQKNEPNSEVRALLDDAARAYMDGDYDAAVAAWKGVLKADPSNPRAREGIKKVSMLQAEDRGQEDAESDPVLEEIHGLLHKRRFDEAVQVCRTHAEEAGPALTSRLRKLGARAERARAMEPEIQRCMLDARRCLQEGKVREALPHLKQVLTLDRTHPVAMRLMNGIRERVRKRAAGPAGAETASNLPPLPASGAPGSDASPRGPAVSSEPPAPPGRGLPSSPAGDNRQNAFSEIDIEMQPLEPEPAPGDDTADAGADQDGEVVVGQPMEIHLEPESDSSEMSHRSARTGLEPDSPFTGDEEDEPELKSVPLDETGRQAAAEPEKTSPDILDATAGIGRQPSEESAPRLQDLPPAPRKPRKKARRMPVGAIAAVLLVAAGGVAAWWFGLIPGLSTPAPRPLAVARPSSPELPAGTDGLSAPAPRSTEPGAGTSDGPGAGESAARAAAPVGGSQPSPRQPRDPQAALILFEQGQDLYGAGEYAQAARTFKEALALDPVNPDIADWQSRAEGQVRERRRVEAQRSTAVEAFQSKDFETALRKFYRLQQEEPDGPYTRYIANSWYNWGLQFLAAGNLREADLKMNEVLTVEPDDQKALAIKKLVTEYQNRAKDRLFYIRIEALRYRPLDS